MMGARDAALTEDGTKRGEFADVVQTDAEGEKSAKDVAMRGFTEGGGFVGLSLANVLSHCDFLVGFGARTPAGLAAVGIC